MMGWPFSRRPAPPADAAPADLPIFPLGSVLMPGGRLGLKIFEQRYLDMASACLRDNSPFGVCLIAEGEEVGAPAVPHAVGTLATIASCDMPQLGILLASLQGGRRFRLRRQRVEANGLRRAEVELYAEHPLARVTDAHAGLVELLRRVAADRGSERMPEPHFFDDAEWVGFRLTEILPVKALAKQKLLELEDPQSRLQILHTFLSQRGLVK